MSICRLFIEQVVHEDLRAGALYDDEEVAAPSWGGIWGAAEGEPSAAAAVGRTVVVAHRRAREAAAAHVKHRRISSAGSWLINTGVIIILFAGWTLWGTSIAQHHAQSQLATQFHAAKASAPAGPTLIPATTQVPVAPEGHVVAQLQIPSISLSEFVVSGTASSDLSLGPGHYIGTAAPGQAGNVAIAGHRTTHGAPFNALDQVKVGDDVYLTGLSGERLTYVVSQAPFAVSPSDVSVLDNFGDNRVTLSTCNPKFSASQRLIVVAKLRGPQPPPAGAPIAYRIESPGPPGWAWHLLPLVLLEVGVLVLLGTRNRWLSRRYGRTGRWLILGPVWTALVYLLFVTLGNFLPAAI